MDAPPFQFPVVGFTKTVALDSQGDDGVRGFANLEAMATVYLDDEVDLREGMTLIDDSGRSWEMVSVRRVCPAGSLAGQLFRRLFGHPKFVIDCQFVERPPWTFDAVKRRWYAALRANPKAHFKDEAVYRGAEFARVKSARTLTDLLRSPEQDAIDAYRPASYVSQLVNLTGRASRPEFAVQLAISLALFHASLHYKYLLVLPPFLLGLAILLSASVRRVHDLGGSGQWLLLVMAYLIPLTLLDSIAKLPKEVANAAAMAPLVLLALWLCVPPGTPGPNRYGWEPWKPPPEPRPAD